MSLAISEMLNFDTRVNMSLIYPVNVSSVEQIPREESPRGTLASASTIDARLLALIARSYRDVLVREFLGRVNDFSRHRRRYRPTVRYHAVINLRTTY